MDIDILTIHAMHNPGSVFQAYALQKYLQSIGLDNRIIDYRPTYFYTEKSKLKFVLKYILFNKTYVSIKKKYNDFIENEMLLTDTYTSVEELNELEKFANTFITGSDQLWNTDYDCGNDTAFYLDFVKNGRKIAYSTSIGKKLISDKDKEMYKKYLPSFELLSVREKSSANELANLLNKNVTWVCDPVLLLSASDYYRFINCNVVKGKYVMIYMSGKDERLDKVVDYYKKNGYKIVLVGGFTKRCICDQHIKDIGPNDFLSYLIHSEVVVSSSFHATAFSHIFHKNFITIAPKSNGERIISLTDLAGTADHVIHDENVDFNKLTKDIRWDIVDNKLDDYIKNSKEFLNQLKSDF